MMNDEIRARCGVMAGSEKRETSFYLVQSSDFAASGRCDRCRLPRRSLGSHAFIGSLMVAARRRMGRNGTGGGPLCWGLRREMPDADFVDGRWASSPF